MVQDTLLKSKGIRAESRDACRLDESNRPRRIPWSRIPEVGRKNATEASTAQWE